MAQDLKALNRQAIGAAKQYMGGVAWPTVALTLGVVAVYLANLWLFATGAMPLWAAILTGGGLTYLSYTPLHEAVHNNINGGDENYQWLNDLCGYLVGPLIWVAYSSHRVEHFTHHRYTNQPDKDPDYLVSHMETGFFAFLRYGVKFVYVQNAFLPREYWHKSTPGQRLTYCTEVAFAIGWRVAYFLIIPSFATLAFLLTSYLIGGYFTAYWFAYRPHHPYRETARYRNTNSLIMPAWMRPLRWYWLGQDIHSIHHLFPRVPFYRYHALHREIEPILRAHGTPIIGMFSREPVSEKSP